MKEALRKLGLGPNGGNLDNPIWQKEARTSSLKTQEMPSGGRALHRFAPKEDTAKPGIKNEKPWHRMAAYMLNAGRTNSEIAVAAEVCVGHISGLRANRWFQELCATIANENGEEILGALNSYTLEAIEGIHEIATDFENPARVRLTAFTTLLEQAHGKPTQKIVSDISHSVKRSPTEEMTEIQQELAAIRNREIQ